MKIISRIKAYKRGIEKITQSIKSGWAGCSLSESSKAEQLHSQKLEDWLTAILL
jgi:hypothetical protein